MRNEGKIYIWTHFARTKSWVASGLLCPKGAFKYYVPYAIYGDFLARLVITTLTNEILMFSGNPNLTEKTDKRKVKCLWLFAWFINEYNLKTGIYIYRRFKNIYIDLLFPFYWEDNFFFFNMANGSMCTPLGTQWA